MPQLTFAITPDGLSLDARINLDTARLKSLQAVGRPVPVSVPAPALIDTATDITAVASSVLQQVGASLHGHTTTQGISGPVSVRTFKVTLFLLDERQPHLPWFVRPDLIVMELPSKLSADVLIGLDVLLDCKLLLDGPARRFVLDF